MAAFALLLAAWPAFCAEPRRLPDESAEHFAARAGPARLPLVQLAVDAGTDSAASGALAAFYEQPFEQSGQTYRRVLGYLFQPGPRQSYRRLLIDRYEPEGGDPQIEAAFFTGSRPARPGRLVVLSSWPQLHHDFQGRLYEIRVYRLAGATTRATRLKPDPALSEQLEGGCECEWRDGTRTHAPYKSADEIRATLRQLGF